MLEELILLKNAKKLASEDQNSIAWDLTMIIPVSNVISSLVASKYFTYIIGDRHIPYHLFIVSLETT